MNSSYTPESILAQIAQIQHMDRGTVSIIRQGPEGPYYNHQCYEDGKNVSRYVPCDEVTALKEAIAGYQRFQQLVAQYVKVVVERTRAERQGSKKKNPHRSSSWPKTRKSSN